MADWLVEHGIGEVRAARIAGGAIDEIRIDVDDGRLALGEVVPLHVTGRARLPGLDEAETADGLRLLLRGSDAPEGARLHAIVVREAVRERGRAKRAVATPHPGPAAPAPSLADELASAGHAVQCVHAHQPDALEAAGWSDRLAEAATGELVRAGCTLRLSLTPAMTLIDVDGDDPVDRLALAGGREAAALIVLFGLGGSIGIDLPTAGSKAARRAVDDALDAGLPRPFERTATNGFGFVQIIRPRPRPSLPESLAANPIGHQLRALLRQAEREPLGRATALRLPGPLARYLDDHPEWLAELARRRGAAVEVVVTGGATAPDGPLARLAVHPT